MPDFAAASEPFCERIPLRADGDVVRAWKSGLSVSRRLGLPAFKEACLSRAILELSRAAVEGGGGACTVQDASDHGVVRARVVVNAAGAAAENARRLLSGEFRVAPSSPPVRLSQVVAWQASPEPGERASITLTLEHLRREREVLAARSLRAGKNRKTP